MNSKRWIILEDEDTSLVGKFTSHETAQKVCDFLNAKKRKKQIVYSVVEAKEGCTNVFKVNN